MQRNKINTVVKIVRKSETFNERPGKKGLWYSNEIGLMIIHMYAVQRIANKHIEAIEKHPVVYVYARTNVNQTVMFSIHFFFYKIQEMPNL